MPLKLMYITNNPHIAVIAEKAGVDRIFVDMEYIGKDDRQGGMNTVQNHHTIEDVLCIREVISKAELLVRCNPIHEESDIYSSSETEIESIIKCGADIIMLPFFKTVDEVKRFLRVINGRTKSMLLIETPEAVNCLDDILQIPGIDYIHIGLNDLSLGYNKHFMFELLTDGTVEVICAKCKKYKIPYGFGGIASLGNGIIPAEMIIKEHYRLESSCAILSRSFCDINTNLNLESIAQTFNVGMKEIRTFEKICEKKFSFYKENEFELAKKVMGINK